MLSKWYGLISGAGFCVSFSVAGLYWGKLVNTLNRTNLLAATCVIWSLSSLATGCFDSFGVLVLMRAVLGIAMAATDPTAFSMINDMFKSSNIGLANSIWTAAPFVGGGLSSFSEILIQKFGWRNTLYICGAFGLMIAAAVKSFIPEPKKKD